MRGVADRRTVLAGAGVLLLAACSRTPEAPAADVPRLMLGELEARHGGRIGVAALDLASGRRALWRSQERFAFCSTFKLFLAAATLERVGRGEERLDRAVPITRADMIPHAPVTEKAVGGSLTIGELAQAIVEVSDNPAANILIREMGGLTAWRDWTKTLGDSTTLISRLEPELNSALPNDPRDTALPAQTLGNLREVMFGNRLTAEHAQMLEAWLIASPTGAGRIKAAAPQGWRVAHKTGTGSDGPTNDIGVLWPVSGSPILMVVYYDGVEGATPDQRDAVVADATRQALKVLGVEGLGVEGPGVEGSGT